MKPDVARAGAAFTSERGDYLCAFIDLTHENSFGRWKLV